MPEQILVVGEDVLLLKTRAMILSDWLVSTALASDAAEAIQARAFDLVVLGQTVPSSKVTELLALLGNLRPSPTVLLIRFPGDSASFDIETHTTDQHDNPSWLKDRVAALLIERAADLGGAQGAQAAEQKVERRGQRI